MDDATGHREQRVSADTHPDGPQLAFRPAWWLMGKQTLFVGERRR